MKKFLLAGIALLSVSMVPAHAAQVTVGTADTGSAFPFGSSAYLGGYYTQQIYSASQFTSGISINNVKFFQSLYPGTANTGQYRFFLSTTTFNDIANFDINTTIPFADASYTEVFNGNLPTAANGKLSVDLTTSFNYLPKTGNLLLTILNPNLASGGTSFFDADNNSPVTNMRFSAYPYNSNQGLVTQFNGAAIAPVPEPASWAMMIVGVGAIGATMRRRRANVAVRFA